MEVPKWAIDCLADPETGAPLTVDADDLVSDSGLRLSVVDGIVLAHDGDEHLSEHQARFAAPDPFGTPEILRLNQAYFRRLLGGFLIGLNVGTVVVDYGAADCEFHELNPALRYLPIDLSLSRLQNAVLLSRTSFAILADIRRPPPLAPIPEGALVCTHTLVHLPDSQAIAALDQILTRLGGPKAVALTVQASITPTVTDLLAGHGYESIDVKRLRNTDASRYWKRACTALVSRVPSRSRGRAGAAANAIAHVAATAEPLLSRRGLPYTCWVEAHLTAEGRRTSSKAIAGGQLGRPQSAPPIDDST